MKKFKDISEFENLLKGELTKHSVPPPPDAWSAVSSGITGNSAGLVSQISSYLSSFTNVLKVALFAGGISAVGVTLYTSNNPSAKEEIKTPITEVVSSEKEQQDKEISEEESPDLIVDSKINKQNKEQRSVSESTANESQDNGTGSNTKTVVQANVPSSDLAEQAQNEPNAENSTEKVDASIALALFASTNTPCLGQTITVTNTRKEQGTWMENGKVILTNSATLDYKCKSNGIVNISFQGNEQITNTILKVQSVSAEILANKGLDKNYTFTLSKSTLNANWYLDGQQLAKNASQLQTIITTSGKHVVKAEVLNSICPASFTKEIVVKSKGKIEFYNIITPNGDGKNDNYVVSIENYEFFLIRIFDVKNNLVFESQNTDLQWNGNYQTSGQKCPNGEYVATLSYKLTGEDTKQKNIKITLLRD